MPIALIDKSNQEGETFFQLNKKTKKGRYTIFPKSTQYKFCEGISINGFDRLPSGFYTNDGIGLTRAGSFLLQEISSACGSKKVALTIVANGKSSLDSRGERVKAVINHRDLSDINSKVALIKRIRNEETRTEVRRFLARDYRQFKKFKGEAPKYAAGTLAQNLQQKDLLSRLSPEDRAKLEEFIPEYLFSIKGTLRSKAKLQVIFDALDAGKKVYLEKIISA